MAKYKFIKSKIQMRNELYNIWNNFEVYKFLEGYHWIHNKEKEICECLMEKDRADFIEGCRIDWIMKDYLK